MSARSSELVRVGQPGALVRLPLDRFVLDGTTVRDRDGSVVAAAVRVDEPFDAGRAPGDGAVVAGLSSRELGLVAECWYVAARRSLRSERDPQRRAVLVSAMGQARVLQALAGDVRHDLPTARDFDAATAAGLLTPARLREVRRPVATTRDPLQRHRDQAALVGERLELLAGDGLARLRSRSAFAGITAAAALVLTGCSSEPEAGDRRCTDGSGRVVDDSNCRQYGGGGAGGYYYRYGGSTYSSDGGTYLRGGSTTAPEKGSGFRGSSGGGG